MEEIYAAIRAAGNNPDALRQVALQFNLDPAFVASVASGASRTTMGQSFDIPLLISSGIISPESLSGGFAQAEESALKEAMQEWDKAYANLIPDAPRFDSFVEAKHSVNPVAADAFATIRLGTPVTSVINSDAIQGLKSSISQAEFDELIGDLETFDTEWSKHEQDLYEYQTAGGGAKLQAAMMSLGERPSAETFDTSAARLDYAKALGVPALALLPDPMQQAPVSTAELQSAVGGEKRFQSMIDMINKHYDRGLYDATQDKPVATAIRGYGAIGREPEGVAPLSSLPFSAISGASGMDVYERLANTPESQRVQGLQGAAATTGRAPQAPRGLSKRDIAMLEYDIGVEKEAEFTAGLNKIAQMLAAKKPNPFQQALGQYGVFGALEANV